MHGGGLPSECVTDLDQQDNCTAHILFSLMRAVLSLVQCSFCPSLLSVELFPYKSSVLYFCTWTWIEHAPM